jgi:uncharacterized protein YceK
MKRTIKRLPFLFLIGFSLVAQSGCLMGTLATRTDRVEQTSETKQEVSPFGGIPYAATGSDLAGLQDFNDQDDVGPIAASLSFVSIPLDFVVDTICLPIDLILWPCGFRKNNTPYRHE